MIKACCISCYSSENNILKIQDTCEKYGYTISFYESADEADGKVSDVEVAYCTSPALLNQMKNLRWCHTDSAGVDNYIKTGLFTDRTILLTNSSGAFGRAISEHIIMVTLMLMRRMPEYNRIVSSKQWKHDLSIRSIAGSNVAIIGTGNLGMTAAEKFRNLGAANVIGFSRSGKNKKPFSNVYQMHEFGSRIQDADVIVLCLPDTPETRGIMDAEKIAMIPETAFLINVGRGTTIDQDALINSLNEEKIAGAALDVVNPEPLPPEHPLWTAKNCVITPHCSGDMGLEYSVDKTVDYFCENLKRYAEGKPLINLIDPDAGY